MKKLWKFITESNHWKHLVGGFAVGLLSFSGVWSALYTSAVAASCLEFKDKCWGGKWDWIDWSFTVFGGVLAAGLILLF